MITAILQSYPVGSATAVVGVVSLVALHRLWPRPTRRVVATTLFWQGDKRHDHYRVLGRRLSRLWTFILLLAILLLLCTALSGWRRSPAGDGGAVVLVVDTGYAMAARAGDNGSPTKQQEAVARLLEDVRALAGQHLWVVEAGPEPRVLWRQSDPPELVQLAVARIQPHERPSDRPRALRLAGSLMPHVGGHVILYSDHPLSEMERQSVGRQALDVRLVGHAARNAAILAAIYAPNAADEAKGTVYVRVRGPQGDQDAPRVRLSPSENGRDEEVSAAPEGRGEFLATFSGISARAGDFTVQVVGNGDDVGIDGRITLRMPDHVSPTFHLSSPVPAELVSALVSIGTIRSDPAPGTIEVGHVTANAPIPSGPGIYIIRASDDTSLVSAGAIIRSAGNEGVAKDWDAEAAVCGVGPDLKSLTVGGIPLLNAGNSEVAAIVNNSGIPSLLLSDALFSAGSTAAQRPQFFLALRDAVNALTRSAPFPASIPERRRLADPKWKPPVDGLAEGTWVLADRQDTSSVHEPARVAESFQKRGGIVPRFDPWELALVAAVAAVALESFLYRTGRIA